ncbi:endonuclease domain-containing protein [Marinoscillum sp.]|uniref:endonuclease domain-containing protein n=1 Tax=Marinoscillum sp. TaxID=2024838 RepID=UPI003BAB961B
MKSIIFNLVKRKIIPYNPALKELARQLRNNSTKSEIRLWQCLKGKQMCGYDFHRQKPLLEYIADFYYYELELVIELDGYTHQFEEVIIKDALKQKQLVGNRFDGNEVCR